MTFHFHCMFLFSLFLRLFSCFLPPIILVTTRHTLSRHFLLLRLVDRFLLYAHPRRLPMPLAAQRSSMAHDYATACRPLRHCLSDALWLYAATLPARCAGERCRASRHVTCWLRAIIYVICKLRALYERCRCQIYARAVIIFHKARRDAGLMSLLSVPELLSLCYATTRRASRWRRRRAVRMAQCCAYASAPLCAMPRSSYGYASE